MEPKYRIIAPDVNRLLGCYEGFQNPEQPSVALMEALDPIIRAMTDLAPFPKNDEAKGICVKAVPGTAVT